MKEKILNLIEKIKENKKIILKVTVAVIGIIAIIFIINKIQYIREENNIPQKDRYVAPPTPTITKLVPDAVTKTPTSTTNKTTTTKTKR